MYRKCKCTNKLVHVLVHVLARDLRAEFPISRFATLGEIEFNWSLILKCVEHLKQQWTSTITFKACNIIFHMNIPLKTYWWETKRFNSPFHHNQTKEFGFEKYSYLNKRRTLNWENFLYLSRKISFRWFQCIPCQAFEHFQYHEPILSKVTSTIYKPVSPICYPPFNNESISHPIVASYKLPVINRVKWGASNDFLNYCLSQNEVKISLPFPPLCRTLKFWVNITDM